MRARGATGSIVSGFMPALLDIMTHKRFKDLRKKRRTGSGATCSPSGALWAWPSWGTVVGIGTMAGFMHTPSPSWDMSRPLESFFKIFAIACAVVIFVGLVILLVDRLGDGEKRRKSAPYFDWLFLLGLTGVVITGILSQSARLAETAGRHVSGLLHPPGSHFRAFLFAPYTKFAHLIYRTVGHGGLEK